MSFFTITPRWDDLYFEGIPTHDLVFITNSDDPAEIYRQVETEAAKEGLFFQPFLIRPALSHRRTGELTYGPMSIVMPPKGIQLGHNFNIDDYIFTHEGVKFVRVPVFKLRIGFRYGNSFPRGYNIHIYISPGFHTVTPHGDFGLEENNAERNGALIKLMTDHFDSESFYFAHISSYCFEGHSDVYGVGVPGSAAAGRILQTLPTQTPAVQTIPVQTPAPQSTEPQVMEPRSREPRMPHPRKNKETKAIDPQSREPRMSHPRKHQPRKPTSFVSCSHRNKGHPRIAPRYLAIIIFDIISYICKQNLILQPMKRVVLVLAMLWGVIFGTCKAYCADNRSAQTVMQPDSSKSIFAPDFAYPADVIATARAFLEAHPANDDPADKMRTLEAERLLAAQEETEAELDIDRRKVNTVISRLLRLAHLERDPATRAMFLAYTAGICRSRGYSGSGFLKTPVPDRIEDWAKDAIFAAADSLFAIAYNTAPLDTPLSDYAAALTEINPNIRLISTVRDFILYIWTLGLQSVHSNETIEAAVADIPEFSPLWFYAKVKDTRSLEQKLKFLDDNFDHPNLVYGVIALFNGNADCKSVPVFEFCRKFSATRVPGWFVEPLADYIRICESQAWNLELPVGNLAADIPFDVCITSVNTDSLIFDVYRFDNEGAMLSLPSVAKAQKLDAWVFPTHSSPEIKTDTFRVCLPSGYYYIKARNTDLSARFVVMPWVVFSANPSPGVTVVQVLDGAGGKGVRNIGVEAYVNASQYSPVRATTDSDGIAVFKKEIGPTLILHDPKTGVKYKMNGIWDYYRGDTDNVSDRVWVSLTTDLPAYHPGDTVRWESVARDDLHTVKGYKSSLEVKVPKDRAQLETIIKTDMEPADDFGRTHGWFVLPPETGLGTGYIQTDNGSIHFIIADFKLPEVNIADTKYIFNGDSVTVSGLVLNQTGAPRASTDVSLTLTKYRYENSTVVMKGVTDAQGKFVFTFPRLPFGAAPDDTATDSHTQFTVEASTPDGYNATFISSYPDYNNAWAAVVYNQREYDLSQGLGFEIKTEVYGTDNPDAPIKCRWKISRRNNAPDGDMETVLSGEAMTGMVSLPASMVDTLSAGPYWIDVMPADLRGTESSSRVIFYNTATRELPVSDVPFWIPSASNTFERTSDDKVEITVGCAQNGTLLWYVPVPDTGRKKSHSAPNIRRVKLGKGFCKVKFEVGDADRLFVWSVRDGKTQNVTLSLAKKADTDTLALSVETFRDNTFAGGREYWTFVTRRQGRPVGAALSVDVFDSRLSSYGSPLAIALARRTKPEFFGNSVFARLLFNGNRDIYNLYRSYTLPADLIAALYPTWLYSGLRYDGAVRVRNANVLYSSSATSGGMYGARSPVLMDMVMQETATDYAAVGTLNISDMATKSFAAGYFAADAEAVADEDDMALSTDGVAVRLGNRLNALWSPMLVTDSVSGSVNIDFLLPNQSATWTLKAVAWTSDLKSAVLTRTFTATKPVYVKPNLPRFVRVGDRVDVVTAITNTTDSTRRVLYDADFGTDIARGTIELGPGATRYVTVPVDIAGAIALADSLSFTFRATTGEYGDGERVVIPILSSSALVVESTPFYMNASDSVLCLDVPAPQGPDDRVELHFTANPMWTVVEALPAVIDEYDAMCPTSTYYAMAWYSARTAMRIADTHPEATDLIDVSKASKMRRAALEGLRKMQHPDGGFGWGTWSDSSSLWNSLNVLSWFDRDTDEADIAAMTGRLLDYIDNNITPKGAKAAVNITYAYVRSAFGEPSTLEGRAVIDVTINHILRNWKSLSLADKCLAATLLARNGYKSTASQILRSVRQYGVVTPDRGLVFPNMPGLNAYANMLVAFHAVDPANPIVDAVRQALVCMRRGASWGTTAYTAYAVRAMVMTGTDWTVAAEAPTVTVDGRTAVIPASDNMRGAFSLPLSGGEVCIRRESFLPAYGAIVSERVAPLTDVAPFSTESLSLTKTVYVADAEGKRVVLESAAVRPGQKVTVSLRIYTDTDMTDVTVTDHRSAALEPVMQTGRYMRSATGTWYYLQNGNLSTNIFIDSLKRGYTEVEYEAVINNAGTFTTGIATLTNGIDPDLTVHSGSKVLEVK